MVQYQTIIVFKSDGSDLSILFNQTQSPVHSAASSDQCSQFRLTFNQLYKYIDLFHSTKLYMVAAQEISLF
jgi:hypothetical protein